MPSPLHLSIRKSSMWMIARFIISFTIGAFITTYIIRSLPVVDYGIYNLLYAFISYVSVIASFGIPSVFQRFIPEVFERKEYSLLKNLVMRGLILRFTLSLIVVSIIFLFHEPVGRLLKVEGWMDYFAVFGWGIVIYLEAGLLTNVLHSLFLHKYAVIAGTLYTVFRGICMFLVLRSGWGVQGVLWAEVAGWALWLFLQFFFYYAKFLRRHPGGGMTRFPLRRYFRYGGLSSLNELGSSVLAVSTDFFIITAFLGPGAVAYYAFADRVVKLFSHAMPHVVLIDVIRPAFFSKYAQSGKERHLNDMFNLLLKMGAFFMIPLAAAFFLLGDKMISFVFKPEYLPAGMILMIMTAFTAIDVFANPTGLVLQSIEKVQIILYSKVFAIYNLLAALVAVQWFGVLGVVIVTCSAVTMKNLFCYYFARKYVGIRADWRGLFAIAVNTAVMCLILWPMTSLATGLLSLVSVAAAGGIVYLTASWCNKAFTVQERAGVNNVAPRPIFVF